MQYQFNVIILYITAIACYEHLTQFGEEFGVSVYCISLSYTEEGLIQIEISLFFIQASIKLSHPPISIDADVKSELNNILLMDTNKAFLLLLT